jgi:anti-sigma factor ChrR (cupin superfamily)
VHGGPEECYVLEGDLRVDDKTMGQGDYQFAPEGCEHSVQSTEGGCLLLISSSLSDRTID